jgi:hypothetical protein
MVDLIWFGFGKDSAKRCVITEVGIMKEQLLSINTSVLNQVLYPPAVKGTRTAHNSVYLIAFFQKQLSEVGTILSGNACDESFFQIGNKLKKTIENTNPLLANFIMRIFELINQ